MRAQRPGYQFMDATAPNKGVYHPRTYCPAMTRPLYWLCPTPSYCCPRCHPRHQFLATFTHSVQTQANTMKISHQSLCKPKIILLLKAICNGFVKGFPNMMKSLVLKYLNPRPATAKGHIKCPRHDIWSTWQKATTTDNVPIILRAQIAPPVFPLFNNILVYPGPA